MLSRWRRSWWWWSRAGRSRRRSVSRTAWWGSTPAPPATPARTCSHCWREGSPQPSPSTDRYRDMGTIFHIISYHIWSNLIFKKFLWHNVMELLYELVFALTPCFRWPRWRRRWCWVLLTSRRWPESGMTRTRTRGTGCPPSTTRCPPALSAAHSTHPTNFSDLWRNLCNRRLNSISWNLSWLNTMVVLVYE